MIDVDICQHVSQLLLKINIFFNDIAKNNDNLTMKKINYLNMRIERDCTEILERVKEETGKTKTALIEEAIIAMYDKREAHDILDSIKKEFETINNKLDTIIALFAKFK